MKNLSAKELKAKIDGGESVLLVDLQDPHEYEHRHIPGAVNVAVDETCKNECQRLVADKEAAIVVYDAFEEEGKASRVSGILVGMGCKNVSLLDGGLMGWMESGYAVEGGRES